MSLNGLLHQQIKNIIVSMSNDNTLAGLMSAEGAKRITEAAIDASINKMVRNQLETAINMIIAAAESEKFEVFIYDREHVPGTESNEIPDISPKTIKALEKLGYTVTEEFNIAFTTPSKKHIGIRINWN
jgi:hypothetical protein